MSSDFYFKKWRQTLKYLQNIVDIDDIYQSSKAHDKTLCDAVVRLSTILAQYTATYNDIMDCYQHNLQVQKTISKERILHAVVARILEIKHQLRKLEGNDYHFLTEGLIFSKLTPFDTELNEIPTVKKRSDYLQAMVDEAFEAERVRLRDIEESKPVIEVEKIEKNWWELDGTAEEEEQIAEDKVVLTQKQIERKKNIELIQAHERSRQVVFANIRRKNKREKWKKELLGLAPPPAPLEVRERSAKLIQCVCRKYFEIKRERIKTCKRDGIIGIKSCLKPKSVEQATWKQETEKRMKLKSTYEETRSLNYQTIKDKFMKLRSEDIKDDYRDFITEWFKLWFKEIHLFHDIPDIKQGGITSIIKEDTPTPSEWLKQYEEYLANKKANKNKTAMQLKYEKMEAKREEVAKKRKEIRKKRFEEQLRKKIMKNTSLHPGYTYPMSKKIEYLKEVIDKYNETWTDLDKTESKDVKENAIKELDHENICKEVKIEMTAAIDSDMRNELNILEKALKKDYENNDIKMPETMKVKRKRENIKIVKNIGSELNIKDIIQDLTFRGFLKEYPKTKLEDYQGDPNFAGHEFRCNYKKAHYSEGEVRSVWWDKCRDLVHGFQKILLVGPGGSGKTTLVHAMASINDAVLFELDPLRVRSELQSDVYLEQAVSSLATCAKALQPAVIHIKDVQRLYHKKVPSTESVNNYNLMRRYFVNKLNKRFLKHDCVTIVATCLDPWLTKSNRMLKKYPNVIMLPKTSYSNVVQLLQEWVQSNKVIPQDFNVSCLANVLKGYSYGCIKTMLNNILSPEMVVRIKNHGLSPMDVYNYILIQETVHEINYDKYEKWYYERTMAGKREKKHFDSQLEFKLAVDKYTEKAKSKKIKSSHSNLNEE